MINVKNILLVLFGSGLGGIFRFIISSLLRSKNTSSFPWSTFVVNVVGCLLIGFIFAWVTRNTKGSEEWKLLMSTGFCGGFTTFSAFAAETLDLFKNGNYHIALGYIMLSVVFGILAVMAGIIILK